LTIDFKFACCFKIGELIRIRGFAFHGPLKVGRTEWGVLTEEEAN